MISKHSWRGRLGLAVASAGALLVPVFAPVAVAAPGDLTDAQVAHYSFDADEIGTDSWGDRNGTVKGKVPAVEGKVKKAASITEGNSIEFEKLDLGRDWTVGFWVKAPTAKDKSNILVSADGERAISQRINAAKGDKMGIYVNSNPGGFLTYNHGLPNDTWTHITWTHSQTEGPTLYIDGKLMQSKDWAAEHPVKVPADVLGGEGFTGLVDELKIYKRALTAEEVPTIIEGLEAEEPEPEPEKPAAPEMKARFSIIDDKAEGELWQLGETIRFNLDVTNDTDIDRSFKSTDSNLDNWNRCMWTNLPVNDTRACDAAWHTVTQEDVEKGSFTPWIQFEIYGRTGYSGGATAMERFYGEPVQVAAPLVTVESFEFAEDADKDKYVAGDELKAALEIKNPTKAPIDFKLTDESLGCSGKIEAGQTHTCDLTFKVTDDDLLRGEAARSVVVRATQDGKVGTASVEAKKATPTTWDAAKPFTAPNANPALDPELGDEVMLGQHVSGKYNIRIPAIAVASNGDILAAYDLRPTNGRWGGGDSPNENSIVQRRSSDGGKTWSAQTVIAQGNVAPEGKRYGWSDPSYVVDHETGEIFNFFVGSLDAGLPNSPSYVYKEDGTIDTEHRRTMNFTVANSKDNGHTWERRTITNDVLGDRAGDFYGCFATSGAGTQKMYAPHKGRLLQQAACKHKDGNFRAITIYSDDHGASWKGGQFTSNTENAPLFKHWNFDENKVAELSNGDLMLNSRIPANGVSPGAGYRLIAISKDGGETWGNYHIDWGLQDSQNNAQLMRPFPTAKEGTLRSQVLLFSNTKQHWDRVNGQVSMSFDDGKNWPVAKQVYTGHTGYTTMAVQKDGKIGMLREPYNGQNVSYVNFSLKYLTEDLPFEVALQPIANVTGVDGRAIEPIKMVTKGNDKLLEDTFTAKGLPEGLKIDPATGEITGTPAVRNTERAEFPVTVTITEAEDGTGMPRTSSQTFTITLDPMPIIEVTPEAPAFNPATGELTIPDVEGVTYTIDGKDVTGKIDVAPGTTVTVTATAPYGYVFVKDATTSWDYTADKPAIEIIEKPEKAARATNLLGEATGDRYADLWSVDEDGAIHFYVGTGKGYYHEGIVGIMDKPVVDITPIRDVNGDKRADLLVQYTDGSLYYFYSEGDGFLTKGVQAGHGWNNMDNVVYAGKLGKAKTEYVVARHVPTGDLYRYIITDTGLTGTTKIGQGWSGMTAILAPGQFTGSANADLIAIRADGKMFAYAGADDGTVYGVGQIGHGWTTFDHATIPGDVDGDGRYDLIGINENGQMFTYKNLSRGYWGSAVQVGHGWNNMLVIS